MRKLLKIISHLKYVGRLLTLIFTMNLINSCDHNLEVELPATQVCFDSEVLPIIQTNCAISGCHAAGSEEKSLATYSEIMENVTPGKPQESKLYESLTSIWDELMPPAPKKVLSQEQREIIYIWIKQGAKENCN